ncbi:hypothetical protein RhiirC2_771564, partial [Rhizophagus irregularis]
MSANYCLNSKNFAITILNDEQTQNPCFRCICDGKDSGIQASASAAINNIYVQIFGNKTTKKRIKRVVSNVCAAGCTNITPLVKKKHIIEFWTKASDPSSDRDNLVKLFESGMLLVMEKKSQPNSESEKIWESLQKALEANKRGVDGKVRILSIIAENFTYKKLNEKFG